MAIGGAFLKDLEELKLSGKLNNSSRVIEIGAQQIANSALRDDHALNALYASFGQSRTVFSRPLDRGQVDGIERLAEENPSSREFWHSLGFDYFALDFDGHRDSIAIDLNRDSVPDEMRGTFDLVVNTGTTEHVANQDHAFRIIHDLTRIGGVMMHELPAGGLLSHGFFNYNLKFFWHLCRENSYRVIRLKLVPCGANPVPDDVILSNSQFAGAFDVAMPLVPNFSIVAVLEKTSSALFVTPLDVPAAVMRHHGQPRSLVWRLRSWIARKMMS